MAVPPTDSTPSPSLPLSPPQPQVSKLIGTLAAEDRQKAGADLLDIAALQFFSTGKLFNELMSRKLCIFSLSLIMLLLLP